MNSIFGFVVGLLQAALSLIGFVQQHPELPQVQKDQAQVIAQQAITQAARIVSSSPNSQASSCAAAWGTVYKIFPDGGVDSGPCSCTPINPTDCHITSDVCKKNWPPVCRNGKWVFNDGTVAPSPVPLDSRCTADTQLNTQCGGLYHCAQQVTNGLAMPITQETLTPRIIMWPALDKAGAYWSFTPCDQQGSPQTSPPSSISVPGMSKYTDSDFGFSFWYPSGWTISKSQVMQTLDGNSLSQIMLMNSNTETKTGISFNEISSASGKVSDPVLATPDWIQFDSTSHTWMRYDSSRASLVPADVSMNTVGGLHLIPLGLKAIVVPLSAHTFVSAYVSDSNNILPVLKTIVATDPSVATPVGAAEQIATIQKEKDAYTH